jgi:hypothetical protein
MHSTGLVKNAVQKSYARPLFLVNEKCKLITQVWQNLALTDPSRGLPPGVDVEDRPEAKMLKSLHFGGFNLPAPGVNRVSLGFLPLPF